jgi:tetratricopeptide (TPR) repeat protein
MVFFGRGHVGFRLVRTALFLGATGLATACGGHGGSRAETAAGFAGKIKPLEVSDATFAAEVVSLLQNREQSPERMGRLVGVVRYELARAASLFDSGHDEAGLGAVQGALYLVRTGELHPAMFEGRTAPLLSAANLVSRNGSEGRASALYALLSQALPAGASKSEVAAHVTALERWQQATKSRGALQGLGRDERNAVERALWEPSDVALRAARGATVEWIAGALGYSKEQLPPNDDFEREEAIEAYRAIRTGALTLAALYLRSGNAAGALEAVDGPQVSRVVSPHLRDALHRAADGAEPDALFELFSTFDRLSETAGDASLDAELARAAAWGAAVELCRAQPKSVRGVIPISTLLMKHGMAEVAPLLLEGPLKGAAEPEVASWTLGYVLEALMKYDAVGDLSAARRTFANATALMNFIATHPTLGKGVTPSVSRLRYAMGTLEARTGDLGKAKSLIESTVQSEPTLPALELLAAIDRQRGNASAALKSLTAATKIATETSDPSSVADARLAMFEVYQEVGDSAEASRALDAALRRALDARQLAHTGAEQAAAERILARVLEAYGSLDGSRRATLRAYDASRSDARQLTATVLEAARRGLTRGDLWSARDAARRAVGASLPSEDIVYVALWLRLLERHLGVPSDGTVEEALASIDEDAGWPAKLRAWLLGRLTDEQLMNTARGRVEQTEASFYAAMAAYAVKDTRALERLERIAKSEAIQLVEVAIARDVVFDKKRVRVALPKDVEIP